MRSSTHTRLATCKAVSAPCSTGAHPQVLEPASIDARLLAIEACMADLLALCLKVTEGGVALQVVGRP